MKKRKLSRKHLKFAELIASGATVQEAGQELAIAASTAYKWHSDPGVKEAIEGIRKGVLERIQGRLLSAGKVAVDTLIELCQDKDAPHHVRATSAKGILDSLLKVREVIDVEEKIRLLELRLSEIEGEAHETVQAFKA